MPDFTLPERIAFLGGFLPRLCGIATFTHDVCEAVAAAVPAADCYSGCESLPRQIQVPATGPLRA